MNSEISTLVASVAAMGGAIAASLTFIDKRVAAAVRPLQAEINDLKSRVQVLEDKAHEAHNHVIAARDLTIKGGHDQITEHLDSALEALTSKWMNSSEK